MQGFFLKIFQQREDFLKLFCYKKEFRILISSFKVKAQSLTVLLFFLDKKRVLRPSCMRFLNLWYIWKICLSLSWISRIQGRSLFLPRCLLEHPVGKTQAWKSLFTQKIYPEAFKLALNNSPVLHSGKKGTGIVLLMRTKLQCSMCVGRLWRLIIVVKHLLKFMMSKSSSPYVSLVGVFNKGIVFGCQKRKKPFSFQHALNWGSEKHFTQLRSPC